MSQPVCEVCGGPLRDWPGLTVDHRPSSTIVPIGNKHLAIFPVERGTVDPDQFWITDGHFCEPCIRRAVERAL